MYLCNALYFIFLYSKTKMVWVFSRKTYHSTSWFGIYGRLIVLLWAYSQLFIIVEEDKTLILCEILRITFVEFKLYWWQASHDFTLALFSFMIITTFNYQKWYCMILALCPNSFIIITMISCRVNTLITFKIRHYFFNGFMQLSFLILTFKNFRHFKTFQS